MISKFLNQLRAIEAQNWQKIKNSQPQLKIYWFKKKKCTSGIIKAEYNKVLLPDTFYKGLKSCLIGFTVISS